MKRTVGRVIGLLYFFGPQRWYRNSIDSIIFFVVDELGDRFRYPVDPASIGNVQSDSKQNPSGKLVEQLVRHL